MIKFAHSMMKITKFAHRTMIMMKFADRMMMMMKFADRMMGIMIKFAPRMGLMGSKLNGGNRMRTSNGKLSNELVFGRRKKPQLDLNVNKGDFSSHSCG